MPAWKDKFDNGDILVIDGAMGTELERRGVPMHAEAWSGAALVNHPEAIIGAHEDYIRAGAEVIITNTSRATRDIDRSLVMKPSSRALSTLPSGRATTQTLMSPSRVPSRPWPQGAMLPIPVTVTAMVKSQTA